MDMKREKIRLLITDLDHPVVPNTLESLRNNSECEFYIVGTDTNEDAIGFSWADRQYTVPHASDAEYIKKLKDICRKEHIDLVIPWSDAEVEVISRASSDFKNNGVALLCGSYQSIRLAGDKKNLLEKLKETDIPCPEFESASSADDIEKAAVRLGYPGKKVIVKPRNSHGGRGIWILDSEIQLLQKHPAQHLPLQAFLSVINEAQRLKKNIPEYLVMQFLPGEDYSVDVLADRGMPVYIIPRCRIKAVEGASQRGEITNNPVVSAIVKKIVRMFDLHLNVNIQLRYSLTDGGSPSVYEVNPRISGSIVTNNGAGADLLYYGIRLALGRELPKAETLKVQRTGFVRYWTEKYIKSNERVLI